MASPTLQGILAVPSLGAEIASFNELIPGVPTTEKNLKALLEAMKLKNYIAVKVTPDIRACYRVTDPEDGAGYDQYEGPGISVIICVFISPMWHTVEEETFFNYDADGFYQAILWVKEVVRCVIYRRLCECVGAATDAPSEGSSPIWTCVSNAC